MAGPRNRPPPVAARRAIRYDVAAKIAGKTDGRPPGPIDRTGQAGSSSVDADRIRKLLDAVREGRTGVAEALDQLRHMPFESLGFATVDHHRALRCGFPEVIFCQGKTTSHAARIFDTLAETGANVLATRARRKHYDKVASRHPNAVFHKLARCITLRQRDPLPPAGTVAVVCAGTADLPVAEEARVTAELLDQPTATYYDVGVAGLHRLLAHAPGLREAGVVIVVAGMEGALPSVVGGLVDVPVVAVPTSVGYGASFNGLAPLLTMLNSCAAGVAVVNIDNGFGAAYLAAQINRTAQRLASDASNPALGRGEQVGGGPPNRTDARLSADTAPAGDPLHVAQDH